MFNPGTRWVRYPNRVQDVDPRQKETAMSKITRQEALTAIEAALTKHRVYFAGSQEELGYSPSHPQVCRCDHRHMSQEEGLAHLAVAVLDALKEGGLDLDDDVPLKLAV